MLVILNTSSGQLKNAEQRALLERQLKEAGISAVVRNATTTSEIVEAVRTHPAEERRIVVAAGGDGTVNAVANELLGTDATLGVIPAGTLNHFAGDLKIPSDFRGAVQVLKSGVEVSVDVGMVNGRLFLNNSGLGLYPEMVLKREEIQRRRFNKAIALIAASLLMLLRFPLIRVHLIANGRRIKRWTPFIFVGNNPYILEGSQFGKRPRIDSGELFLCVARERRRIVLLPALFRLAMSGLRRVKALDVLSTKETRISIRRQTIPVSIDGEVVHLETPLHYEIRPRALRVLAPAP